MGTSVGKVGFFGETNKHLWCLTHIETLRYHSSQVTVVSFFTLLPSCMTNFDTKVCGLC